MKDFDWTRFTTQIAVKANIRDIYDAWTKSSEIERWFLSKAVYFDAERNPLDQNKAAHSGCTYEWNWYLYSVTERGAILEANGDNVFSFSFAGNCIVEVKLSEVENHVMVTLTQKNIPTDEKSMKDIRLGCESGWAFYLVNLKSVFEGGLDLRNKNPAFTKVLNG